MLKEQIRYLDKYLQFCSLFSVPDVCDSESDVSLFGEDSSDEYKPDSENLSDSDTEAELTDLQPLQPFYGTGGVVEASDEDEDLLSIQSVSDSQQQVREDPLSLPTDDSNFKSDDDLIGPSDEDVIGPVNNPRVRQFYQTVTVRHPVSVQPTKKKKFSPKPKLSRKRAKNPDEWVRRKAALAREKGEAYTNYKGQLIQAKSVTAQNLCPQKCRLKCDEKFNIASREALFSQFYKLDGNSKNALLFGSIKIHPVKRMRKGATKHKSSTFKYVVTCDGKQTYVCKTALANLFCIGKKKIELVQKSIKDGLSTPNLDQRGKHQNRPHKIDDQVREYIKQHIAQFPAEESHYSRTKNINKKYLSPLLSISKMHKLFLEQCALDNVAQTFYVKECTYRNVFVSDFNLSFGFPKSDTCSTCDAGKSSEEHIQSYHEAYDALRANREQAKNSNNFAYMTMDLQQTMPLPRLSTSKAFYLRQMWLYNFGIHIITKEGDKSVMCSWTEDQAGRGSSEVVSCLLTALEGEESLRDKDHLVIWSDSCAGQNKNFLMICLYQYLISKGLFKTIDHKFPEVGHTYLDSDRDFGRIEKNLRKHQNIFIPEEYRQIISKSSKKIKVIDMTQHFRDTDDLTQKMKLYNRKKDINKNNVQFRDSVRWIRVEEYGSYLFKTNYDENSPFQKVNIFKKLTTTPRLDTLATLPRLQTKTGTLKQPKVDNLREQMIFIPEQYRWWYEQILDTYP